MDHDVQSIDCTIDLSIPTINCLALCNRAQKNGTYMNVLPLPHLANEIRLVFRERFSSVCQHNRLVLTFQLSKGKKNLMQSVTGIKV